ncbi:MAG TPA: 3-methyl-2-oxobutanoate hydroxymethyltransferase [Clostridiales bacterium]|nr:3-methyl-2-oxobutanoate hydroxymethyltransferase [Clostridiales bacterium]
MKETVLTFRKAREEGRKLAILTAYDYAVARWVDACGVDGILVGDSLGMVCLGYEDTLRVTMEDMLHHVKAVVRGVSRSLVIADLPFLSYQVSVAEAVRNAGRMFQEGGAGAVKLEGGSAILPQVRSIVAAGMPVMGHLGLTPQSVHQFGGYKVQGREKAAALQLAKDALALQEAGVFSIVLECVPAEIAAFITRKLTIPTIGIGAGAECGGQVLVIHDMLGMGYTADAGAEAGSVPRFVKPYSQVGEQMARGIRAYVDEVRAGIFPDSQHAYPGDPRVVEELEKHFGPGGTNS